GLRRRYLSGMLVVAEIALTVVLSVGAGLMIRSILNTGRSRAGVDTTNVLTMEIDLTGPKYTRQSDWSRFHRELKARLAAAPGVDVAAVASALPSDRPARFGFELEGAAWVDARERPRIPGIVIDADYFRAMQVRLTEGRPFTNADGSGSARVVIVNRSFA